MPDQNPSPDRQNGLPPLIFLVAAAAGASVSAVAVLREFPVAPPLIAAAAGGVFAHWILVRPPDAKPGWSHIWIVFLSAGCAGLACWTIVLSKAGSLAVATAGPPVFRFSSQYPNRM